MISKEEIFSIQNQKDFNEVALKVFRFQAEENQVYKKFIQFLNLNPAEIHSVGENPF